MNEKNAKLKTSRTKTNERNFSEKTWELTKVLDPHIYSKFYLTRKCFLCWTHFPIYQITVHILKNYTQILWKGRLKPFRIASLRNNTNDYQQNNSHYPHFILKETPHFLKHRNLNWLIFHEPQIFFLFPKSWSNDLTMIHDIINVT